MQMFAIKQFRSALYKANKRENGRYKTSARCSITQQYFRKKASHFIICGQQTPELSAPAAAERHNGMEGLFRLWDSTEIVAILKLF